MVMLIRGRKNMPTTKGTFFMLFGIIVGLCCGILMKNYGALEIINKCNINTNDRHPFDIIRLNPNDTVLNSQENLLFVGVMTAKNFLHGRAKAVFDTWGKEVSGKIAFFSSENSYSNELPVIALKGVDDRYPPQKKSFMMLYYMYEHFIDKFEWFARTDDDVYINTRKLERFLRSIDSSKPQFIGQAGKGNSEEFGLLSLEFDENFCMGGPGVILSRETLRRVAPHIPTCLKNLYSTHEDVEIGRCVQKFAGIPCTWNYEMQSILHHNSSGKYAFTGNLKSKEIHSAITLHPVKQAPLMYRLHAYMKGLRAQELRQKTLALHRDISYMKNLLNTNSHEQSDSVSGGGGVASIFDNSFTINSFLGDHEILGKTPNLLKHNPLNSTELEYWNFLGKSIYSADQSNPKKKMESSFKEGLDDVITEVMESINNFSRQRGRVIEFRDLLYGYSRVNSLYGHDLILDLLLIYKKYRGKKMTVPVRRHLYIQRAFTNMFVRELTEENYNDGDTATAAGGDKLSLISSKVKNLWNTGIGKINNFTRNINRFDAPSSSSSSPALKSIEQNKKIVFVLSLAGRYSTFVRFLNNYKEICLKQPQNTELLIVFFGENTLMSPFYDEISQIRNDFPDAGINYITLMGNFSRGIALDTAARSQYVNPSDILFFIDVDITFQIKSLDRIRKNTIEHQQVYLPIVFSEYDPKRVNPNGNHQYHADIFRDIHDGQPNVSNESGYFRQFGYGICAIYKSDIMNPNINGFNTDITGWGLEDVKFLEQIIKLNKKPRQLLWNTADNIQISDGGEGIMGGDGNRNNNNNDIGGDDDKQPLRLRVFRTPDPSLVHVFHPIECDRKLEESQYLMCIGTKANTLGSYKLIESVLLDNPKIIEYFSNNVNINNNNGNNKQ